MTSQKAVGSEAWETMGGSHSLWVAKCDSDTLFCPIASAYSQLASQPSSLNHIPLLIVAHFASLPK